MEDSGRGAGCVVPGAFEASAPSAPVGVAPSAPSAPVGVAPSAPSAPVGVASSAAEEVRIVGADEARKMLDLVDPASMDLDLDGGDLVAVGAVVHAVEIRVVCACGRRIVLRAPVDGVERCAGCGSRFAVVVGVQAVDSAPCSLALLVARALERLAV